MRNTLCTVHGSTSKTDRTAVSSAASTARSARSSSSTLGDAQERWTFGIRQRRFWDEHAAFADRLVGQGVVILDGPIGSS